MRFERERDSPFPSKTGIFAFRNFVKFAPMFEKQYP